MAKFRKKPVVIEAIQLTEPARYNSDNWPDWLKEARDDGIVEGAHHVEAMHEGFAIRTLEGVMLASIGDWIIRGVKGEIYPCKPDIFTATYEPAE